MTAAELDPESIVDAFRGGLIVSCQAPRNAPLDHPSVLARVAQAVVQVGAVGVRADRPGNVRAVRGVVDVPIIGLWKDYRAKNFITPSLDHALALARAGADVIAIDATTAVRRDGLQISDVIRAIHQEAGRLVLADIATLDQGLRAAEAGADLIATTLSGYVPAPSGRRRPDLDLVRELAAANVAPVIAEGRIRTPAQARAALDAGAHAVVVGAAITDPAQITLAFLDALRKS